MITKLKLYARVVWYWLKGWRIVYKVCYVAEDGGLGSMIQITWNGDHSREAYDIGKVQKPPIKIPHSKLFCFNSERNARRYSGGPYRTVLLCLAKIHDAKPSFVCTPTGSASDYRKFWSPHEPQMKVRRAVKGTVFCDGVLPFKRLGIWIYDGIG